MKRIVSFFLTLCMLMSLFTSMPITASAATSGVYGENLQWSLDDNGTLTVTGTGDVVYNGNEAPWENILFCDKIKTINIGSGITSVDGREFDLCDNLMSIYIPDTVTEIFAPALDGSFGNADNLENIFVDDNNQLFSSREGVLFDKEQTELIVYPPGKRNLSYSVPEGTKSINRFTNSMITSITLPTSITEIPYNNVFDGCPKLESINSESNNFVSINGVLFNKELSEIISYPREKHDQKYTIPNTVSRIGAYTFASCEKLTELVIPNSVTDIEVFAFSNCEYLSSVYIGAKIEIGIADELFSDCTSLKTIIVANDVKINSSHMFSSIENLENIIVEPNNSTCSSLDGVLFDKELTTLIYHPRGKEYNFYNIPKGTSIVNYDAFDCNYNLKKILPVTHKYWQLIFN